MDVLQCNHKQRPQQNRYGRVKGDGREEVSSPMPAVEEAMIEVGNGGWRNLSKG